MFSRQVGGGEPSCLGAAGVGGVCWSPAPSAPAPSPACPLSRWEKVGRGSDTGERSPRPGAWRLRPGATCIFPAEKERPSGHHGSPLLRIRCPDLGGGRVTSGSPSHCLLSLFTLPSLSSPRPHARTTNLLGSVHAPTQGGRVGGHQGTGIPGRSESPRSPLPQPPSTRDACPREAPSRTRAPCSSRRP